MKDLESLKRNIFRFTFLGLSFVTGFLFVALLSTHLYHFSRWIGYVVGLTGLWIGLPILLVLFLSCFILGRRPKWLTFRLLIGLFIALVGISVIWAFVGLKGATTFDYSVYKEAFAAHTNILFVNELGGGLLGTLLASCFKATGINALVYVFAVLIIILGLDLASLPLLIKWGKKTAARAAIRKSKKAEEKELEKEKAENEKAMAEQTPSYLESLGVDNVQTEEAVPERPSLNFDQSPSVSRLDKDETTSEEYIPHVHPYINDGSAPKEAIFILDPIEKETSNAPSSENEEPVISEPIKEAPALEDSYVEKPVSMAEEAVFKIEEDDFKTNEVEEENTIVEEEISEEIMEEPDAIKPQPTKSEEPKPEIPSSPFPKAKARPDYVLPGLDLLKDYDNEAAKAAQLAECEERKEKINKVFEGLHIGAHVISYQVGPSVTRYNIDTNDDVLPAVISKAVSKICAALGGVLANYEESVLGSMYSALEIPNEKRMTVSLKEVIQALPELKEKTRTYIPFGESISGDFYSADLTEFPHMLVAGTSGSGKSVYNNSIILSLLMRNRPEDLKFIMVDPKQVEFMMYEDLPHLLCPVIVDPKEAKVAIEKLIEEMERRNSLIRKAKVKKLSEYNEFAKANGYETLPYIVFIVDEFADLMMTCKGLDESIARLAAKSRSSGIHLILCTQRPSVDVCNGLIKGNMPVRVALSVSSATDSTCILGVGGAENLAGYGDMLVTCGQVVRNSNFRAQGCFVDNSEINNIVSFIKNQQAVEYDPRFLDLSGDNESGINAIPNHSKTLYGMNAGTERDDPDYELVKETVMHCEYYSMSRMNREFHFGFTRSGKIFQWLKEDGIIANEDNKANSKGCKVLVRLNDDVQNSGSTDNSSFIPDD